MSSKNAVTPPGLQSFLDDDELGNFIQKIPFLVLVFDRAGRFVFVNETCHEVLFNNRPLEKSVIEEFAAVLHPEDKERADKALEQTISAESGTSAPEMVIRYLCNDGRYRHFVWVGSVLGDRIFAIARDITDIVQKERVFERFQEVANIGYWRWDAFTSEFTFSASLRRLIGAREDFQYNLASARHIHGEEIFAKAYKKIEQCVQLNVPFDVELEINTVDSRKIWIKLTGAAERVGNQVVGVFGTLQDISTRKYAEIALLEKTRELEKANAYLDQFVYVASHDLRAPLRGIMLLSSLIEEELNEQVKKSGPLLDHLNMLKSRVRRMDRLLETLLEFSVAGEKLGQISEFDTRAALLETFDFLNCDNRKSSLKLNGEFPRIRSYLVPFSTVARNLISNAIKHADKDKPLEIVVEAEIHPFYCEFRVMDNGPGIPAEYQKKVFEVFKTLRPRDEVEGSGMGLPIIKKLLESLGGKIWIDPTYQNGACFVFRWNCEVLSK